jgi:PAS domain-containing protein
VRACTQLLESTDADFSLLVAPDGGLLGASRTVTDVLGWDLALCARAGVWSVLVDPGHRAAFEQLMKQVLATGAARMTLQAPSLDGPLWVDAAAKQLLHEPGPRSSSPPADITHDLAATTQLAASELQWRVAFEQSPIGGALLDADGGVLVVNQALGRDDRLARARADPDGRHPAGGLRGRAAVGAVVERAGRRGRRHDRRGPDGPDGDRRALLGPAHRGRPGRRRVRDGVRPPAWSCRSRTSPAGGRPSWSWPTGR